MINRKLNGKYSSDSMIGDLYGEKGGGRFLTEKKTHGPLNGTARRTRRKENDTEID